MLRPMFFFFQAEDGIRDLVRSRGLGDVYKRQLLTFELDGGQSGNVNNRAMRSSGNTLTYQIYRNSCLLYTSDAADERSSVDLGGRRIIKKKKHKEKTRLYEVIANTTVSKRVIGGNGRIRQKS